MARKAKATLTQGDDLNFMLICNKHDGYCCEFDTKRQALTFKAFPEYWCELCSQEYKTQQTN